MERTYRLSTIRSVVGRIRTNIVIVETLRRFETHVVVAGLIVLAEAELSGRKE